MWLEGMMGAGNTNTTCTDVCLLLLFSASAAHAAQCKTQWSLSHYYISLSHHCVFIWLTSFRPVPTARRSLALGRSSSTSHSLPGASPLDPLVHMFNPSSDMHALFQFWYACFILVVIQVGCILDLSFDWTCTKQLRPYANFKNCLWHSNLNR